jgi:hypothetical protein
MVAVCHTEGRARTDTASRLPGRRQQGPRPGHHPRYDGLRTDEIWQADHTFLDLWVITRRASPVSPLGNSMSDYERLAHAL